MNHSSYKISSCKVYDCREHHGFEDVILNATMAEWRAVTFSPDLGAISLKYTHFEIGLLFGWSKLS
jgi:hypothetical protein